LPAKAKYLTTQAKDDPIEFVHGEIGYNYRLTNVQAAIGCAQIEMLDEYIARKRTIASRYQLSLQETPGIRVMPQAPWAESTFWLYTILVDEKQFGVNSRELIQKLETMGIQSRPLWQPMHQSPVHSRAEATSCETADWLYASAVSLPSSVGLSESDQEHVIESVKRGRQSH
jgi:perosamine synthetase